MRAIDLFAGWGGFTLGAEAAGLDVVWAANHWPLAVEAHALNHPGTEHVCQDLRQADWSALPGYDVLLASPACQGHSSASQPKRRAYHDALRATAWAVVDCAEVTRPKALLVENVPGFARWKLFPLWCEALRILGYRVEVSTHMATGYGVPQRRKRLFVAGRLDREPRLEPRTAKVEPAFGPCIDWELGHWRDWRDPALVAPGGRRRIARGQARHGARFLTQHATGHPGVPLHEAIRTITTKDQWGAVDGDRYRPLTVRETARAMGFPDDYAWPESASRKASIKGLGNSVPPPVVEDLVGRLVA